MVSNLLVGGTIMAIAIWFGYQLYKGIFVYHDWSYTSKERKLLQDKLKN